MQHTLPATRLLHDVQVNPTSITQLALVAGGPPATLEWSAGIGPDQTGRAIVSMGGRERGLIIWEAVDGYRHAFTGECWLRLDNVAVVTTNLLDAIVFAALGHIFEQQGDTLLADLDLGTHRR